MVWLRAAMSVMLPKTLDVWVQQTSRVLGVSKAFRSSGSSFGFVLDFVGIHHLIVSFFHSAIWTHGAMLASWSSFESTISESSGKLRATDRFRKSWVVAAPKTISSGNAWTYLAPAAT